ncbi:MAG: hypothetical protein P1U87_02050 [Verrucomicrobiales bacterium]|nr:hypothetical protein [Verrucomicrobiales bacterium]
MKHFLFLLSISIPLTSLPLTANAQKVTSSKDPAQWALIYKDQMEKNRKALSNYTWYYEVTVMEGEELLYVDLLEATRNESGELQTTTLNQDLKIKKRHGLLSKAGQEKRLADIQEKINFLREVIQSYVYMSRGSVVDFFDKASVSEAVGYNNALRVDGENVLRQGDFITLFGDKATAHPHFLTFSVPYSETIGVDASVDFRHIRNSSVFYGAEITANFVEMKSAKKAQIISIEVKSFDFEKK